ncbi:fluoride efflux transporter CrcB [Formosa algae]|uniref:Fluoride-specific ion channel FluC n=1 Tax=Formosa algae TaxID=225843 RepID=A0A9X1CB14_9FLAO|nr:fluoride efflux transporter CrcB [Formosa algae]MBP1839582.1 CrcB protein [Formosa algae]MDQ0334886.1 CrcB protein [Formosa algae]OEI80613.1 protein CrcB [Formosa algae]
MKQLVLVFIGGGLGSVLRFTISKYINDASTGIPYGTFLANILGSLLIGIILGLADKNHLITHNYTLLLATGFCGGLTTFSTFAFENHVFLKTGDFVNFALYTLFTIIIGFLAVFLGVFLIKNI